MLLFKVWGHPEIQGYSKFNMRYVVHFLLSEV